eukprot:2043420-Amphidinium_carterae.1
MDALMMQHPAGADRKSGASTCILQRMYSCRLILVPTRGFPGLGMCVTACADRGRVFSRMPALPAGQPGTLCDLPLVNFRL